MLAGGKVMTVQVLLASKAAISASMASFHLGSVTTGEKHLGSMVVQIEQQKDL